VSGENGAAPDRYTLGVGGRRSASKSTTLGDVRKHRPANRFGDIDEVTQVSDTRPILTVEPA
jgi:hypothetical protein